MWTQQILLLSLVPHIVSGRAVAETEETPIYFSGSPQSHRASACMALGDALAYLKPSINTVCGSVVTMLRGCKDGMFCDGLVLTSALSLLDLTSISHQEKNLPNSSDKWWALPSRSCPNWAALLYACCPGIIKSILVWIINDMITSPFALSYLTVQLICFWIWQWDPDFPVPGVSPLLCLRKSCSHGPHSKSMINI